MEQMEVVYSMIPKEWHDEIKMFTVDEFSSIVKINKDIHKVKSTDINDRFNKDEFNPRDGEMVKIADDLAAFIEAYSAIKNGIKNSDLNHAIGFIKDKYKKQKSNNTYLNIGEIFADFD
jgi:putative hydrolase of HD superfamily